MNPSTVFSTVDAAEIRAPKSVNVFTPKALATAMVGAIATDELAQWLEPCAGDGALLRALESANVDRDLVTAIDLASDRVAPDSLGDIAHGIDFIAWARRTPDSFDRVIANPPYVSLSRLPDGLRSEALGVLMPTGSAIPAGANYWCAFLCASIRLLRPRACIAFVLPAAWEYADYALPLRQSIPLLFEAFEVHRSRKPLFPSVQDGSVVVIGRGFGGRHKETSQYWYRDADHLITGLANRGSAADSVVREVTAARQTVRTTRLQDVITVSIGAVTGDVDFFLLTEAAREKLHLPMAAVVPAVTRARDLVGAELDPRQWGRLLSAGERVWLFRPQESALSNRAVRAYLALAPENGGCNREAFKIANREPWHRTVLPKRPHGFLSGMSRRGPWIALNTFDRLTASNTLYTIRFRNQLGLDGKAAWCLSLLSTEAQQGLLPLGRRYPDGLLKFEPKDLKDVDLPIPAKTRGALSTYRKAVRQLLNGEADEARRLADSFLEGRTNGSASVTAQSAASRPVRAV